MLIQTDIEGTIENTVLPTIQSRATTNFYLGNFAKIIVSDLNATWKQSNKKLQTVPTGLLENINSSLQVGTFTTGFLRYVEPRGIAEIAFRL